MKKEKDEKQAYEEMILSNYEYTDIDFQIMNDYYLRCMRDGMSSFYDCECLAGRYIQKKVVYADTISDYEIYKETASECVDIVAVAGQTYMECSGIGKVDVRWSEEYCQCYANFYAKAYADGGGGLTRGQRQNARSDAMKECKFARANKQEAEEARRKLANDLKEKARARLELNSR